MRILCALTISAAIAALPIVAAAEPGAQQRSVFGPRNNFHSHSNHFPRDRGHGFHGGFGGVFIVEREVPVIIEREVPAAAVTPPPTPPQKEESKRKPYVVGGTYASLPAWCMKMIEEGVSYYYCGGDEWYEQTGKQYRAVERKL